jgi:hypothetical protein
MIQDLSCYSFGNGFAVKAVSSEGDFYVRSVGQVSASPGSARASVTAISLSTAGTKTDAYSLAQTQFMFPSLSTSSYGFGIASASASLL